MFVLHRKDDKDKNDVGSIYYGTTAENGKDMARNGTANKGEARYNAILTEDDVRRIRELRPCMSLHALAKMFGTRHSNICTIVARRGWKHVE